MGASDFSPIRVIITPGALQASKKGGKDSGFAADGYTDSPDHTDNGRKSSGTLQPTQIRGCLMNGVHRAMADALSLPHKKGVRFDPLSRRSCKHAQTRRAHNKAN